MTYHIPPRESLYYQIKLAERRAWAGIKHPRILPHKKHRKFTPEAAKKVEAFRAKHGIHNRRFIPGNNHNVSLKKVTLPKLTFMKGD